ncbi:Cof-type HAD-IIB family hydrolase [Lactobacillus sp. ESL0684]|uniref:Cof-type HAD-IIB family hydrolase n=1 Tax=Lactobacillus sp. ESL0684 TaxID=2983213 RepID=UPI0023F67EFE|nr:Cof-type HAD-IIB family hydrolase [Lactobacillus sp. ESL0684]WEV43076.1 Cof-type HAD-IIB family hydrolase [Lactobacillus sp. ESL0684]
MIKLVACDLDGTLFNSNMTVSSENISAIRAAQDSGIEFLVATGRSPEQARSALKDFDLQTGFINANGALVYDANGNLQVKHLLPTAKARAVAEILYKHQIYFEIVTKSKIYSADISQRVVNLAHSLIALNPNVTFKEAVAISAGSNAMLSMTLVDNFEQLLADPQLEITKIIAFDGRGYAAFKEVKEEITALGDLAVTSSSAANIEINDIRAQKGSALLDYAHKQGLKTEEIAAIGDNLNDESMIRAAGTGVAMANAVPAIKQVAQIETKSNNDDGVGHILRQFIKNNAQE